MCVPPLYSFSTPKSPKKRKREKRDDDLILKLFKTLQSLSSLHRRVDTGRREGKSNNEEKEGALG